MVSLSVPTVGPMIVVEKRAVVLDRFSSNLLQVPVGDQRFGKVCNGFWKDKLGPVAPPT